MLSGVNIDRELQKRDLEIATPEGLRALSETERARSVVVVQDAFTSYYETPLLLDLLDLMLKLGFRPWLAPYRANGKALQVHGFLGAFERVAATNAVMLQDLAATGVELVGLDPSMTLTYRSEYASALGANSLPAVPLVQEWLAQHRDALPMIGAGTEYQLLPHCTTHYGARCCPRLGLRLQRVWLATDDSTIGLLRYGRDMGSRGGAPRDVGAHLFPELGPLRGGSWDFGNAGGRWLLVPISGEADRRCKAAASRTGPLDRNSGLDRCGGAPRSRSSQYRHLRPPPDPVAIQND